MTLAFCKTARDWGEDFPWDLVVQRLSEGRVWEVLLASFYKWLPRKENAIFLSRGSEMAAPMGAISFTPPEK